MENENKYQKKLEKIFFGTLLWGVIINFVILTLIDNFDKSEECINRFSDDSPCTIYPLLLIISLFIGWLVSIIISKIERLKN